MSIKFLTGFELRSAPDDGIAIHGGFAGGLSYDTLTPTINSSYSVRYFNFSEGIFSLEIEGSVNECWIGSQLYISGTSGQITYGLSAGDATKYINAGIVNNAWVIQINGSTKATLSGSGINQWHRLHLHVGGTSAGSTIYLYSGGNVTAPLIQYTLTPADVAGWPVSFGSVTFAAGGIAPTHIDDLWLMDPTDGAGTTDVQETLSFSVQLLRPDADGPDFSFATGSFADVDEVPYNLSDKITADATGQIADLSFEDAAPAQVIGAIKITQRTQRTGTVAGSRAEISIDDGTNNTVIETAIVPGDDRIRTYCSTSADATALEVGKLNNSTIQIKTVT